jgi:formylglycine-generating enzyme required for sulfatase activity
VCLVLVAGVGLVPGVATPAPVPPPERKNFTETLRPADRDNELPAVKFDMIYVPGGEFTMGSPGDEPGRDANEGPAHRVRVAGFWMGKCEVTWDEFDLFMRDENYLRGRPAGAQTRPGRGHPAEQFLHR